jgi:hypothetical protein
MTARLVSLHARLLCRAAERRAAADRHRLTGAVERAEMAQDEAAEALADANALRDALAEVGGVFIHSDPRQMVLMALGETDE